MPRLYKRHGLSGQQEINRIIRSYAGKSKPSRIPKFTRAMIGPQAVGFGNFLTRNYRQKYYLGTNYRNMPNYVPSGLFVAKHKYKPPSKPAPNKFKMNQVNQRKAKVVKNKLAINKQIQDLRKAIKIDKSLHTFKRVDIASHKSLVGRCNHTGYAGISLAEMEDAIANLRYYDPATPGTLITANANTGTFARDVHFKDYFIKSEFRNNYQVPVRLRLYLCKVKNDCNENTLTTYTTAIADQVITAGADETDQLLYLSDIERVKEVWNVDCVIDKTLEPGQEASHSHSTGPIDFDPSHVDSFTDAYQQVFKAFYYVVRVEGVMGHDTAAAEVSLLAAGVDYMVTRKAVIEYNAGVALNDIFIDENRIQTFTNGGTTGGVCSLKPVADNTAYSVS